jgi:putative peptidoglycan lipid II flippase
MQLPVAVVGQALATAALPAFANLWSAGRREELERVTLTTLQVGLGLALLASAAGLVFAAPAVSLVYERGSFGGEDAIQVSLLFAIFSLAVPAWVTQQIAVRAFFARGDTWRPMLLASVVVLAAIPLYRTFGARFGAGGLALAGVVAMTTNALLTLVLARVLHGTPRLSALAGTALRAIAISVLASSCATWTLLARAAQPSPAADLLIGGGVFGVVAVAGVLAIGDAPMRGAVLALLRRLRRAG